MTKQELIDKLEKDPIEEYVYGTDVDPLVVEGKLNLILQYLKRPGDAEGTDVYLLDQFIKRLDFKENPQDAIDRLDGLIDSLDSTKADNDQLQAVINSLADKANVGTEKETTLSVSTLQEFQDHFYQLRKLPSRSYQYEVSSSLNLDLMDVLGWPNGNGNQAFIYVDLPYNESGGFEIDITYMERFHNNMYKRTMTSTNNGNWQDTGWVQYVSKAEVNNLSMCPSDTIDNIKLEFQDSILNIPVLNRQGYLIIILEATKNIGAEFNYSIWFKNGNVISKLYIPVYNLYNNSNVATISIPISSNYDFIRLYYSDRTNIQSAKAYFIHAKEL